MKMENDAESLNVGLSLKKKIMMAVLMVSSGVEGIIFFLIGSFFPEQALHRGLQKEDVGVIMSSFAISMIVLTFAVGAMIPKLGSRLSFLLSLTVSALILIPFSLVMHAPSKSIFYFSSVACRVVQGVSYLGIQLSSIAIITVEFKKHVSTFLGLREMCFGIGGTIGPLFGAVLFENFGFETPFLASAAVIAIITIIGYITVRPENNYMTDEGEQSDKLQNFKVILSNPEILLNFLQNALAAMFMTYIDGWLAPYIVYKFKKSVTFAGSYLMIAGFIHIICAPIVGHLADSKNLHRSLIAIGVCVISIGQFLYGPAPFLHLDSSLWLLAISLVLLGVGLTTSIVPTNENGEQCREPKRGVIAEEEDNDGRLNGKYIFEKALQKGLQKEDVGVIMSSFAIAMIVLTFAVGAMIPKLGSRLSFLLSLTVSALILIPFS
ncbi:MFS-type transporter SLC18B1 [Nymphon striatum]|nr:MFS-type transporter SLC18B1 [Nymphon striatum]